MHGRTFYQDALICASLVESTQAFVGPVYASPGTSVLPHTKYGNGSASDRHRSGPT